MAQSYYLELLKEKGIELKRDQKSTWRALYGHQFAERKIKNSVK